ncbi:MAG: arginine--tRNA ligase [Candidatus Nanopelagicales bacterium]|nr:arginine--tRNA ligase [Candidatus Nanopelagicales bacterium]MCF8537752.1 arginine--tRNA ligase [Candidatus Nanopelagicales bacterium]MCF8543042.1 arginine--tRNA ligase [Candidatus Nanopelagicales bacterium]MCF8558157.1 arginine--tRNA ligase [Candidatus Nanopelagicales bacterium]
MAAGSVPALDVPEVRIERPKSREHGDYATNVALALAKSAGMPPREIGVLLAERLASADGVASAEVAGPGFVNIRLDSAVQGQLARTVVEAGSTWGHGDSLAGKRVNVEFISANPTGPLHLGHTRWAAVGDAIARVLTAAGAEVSTEFYINDRGVQMDKFGASVMAAAHGRPVPEDGYHGGYILDLAAAIMMARPDITDLPEDQQLVAFREAAYALQLRQQQQVLELFRTHFDVWFSERSLHESGAVERGMAKLREQGHVFEDGGAVWLRTTDFGDDKDRVLVKADGEYTYFASDTAYYVDKRARGFDINIYLLGADHHGYVNRLRAVAACAGDSMDENVEVLIGQLVKITRGGEEVKLSKRAGTIVTLDDLVEEVGIDAARYTLSRYPADSPLTLDLEEMTRATSENPVFYVQYAHARIASVLRNAAELGVDWRAAGYDAALLDHERENNLLGMIAEYPRVVASAAELREPHRVARYLEDLATAYHRFYDVCRVLPRSDEELAPVHVSRLWLCAAARLTVENGLGLLGVSAPERM